MRHLDLFSGIGGFALAVDTVWHETNNEHIFVEWEAFPQAVLRKHWPNSLICGDIRQFIANTRGEEPGWLPTQWRNGVAETGKSHCDIITGGFPCQPFSHAGRRKGTEDDRYLWPPMLEAIALFKPRWVIAENVRGLTTWNDGLVLETVCADLEREGYEVWPLIIPAASVGAPHRRDRVWIVANRIGARLEGCGAQSELQEPASYSRLPRHVHFGEGSDDSNSTMPRLERRTRTLVQRNWERFANGNRGCWNEDWPEVATRLCTVDDGLPGGLVRPRGWRNAALKAAGNAIVPQVAMEIMYAIKSVDNCA